MVQLFLTIFMVVAYALAAAILTYLSICSIEDSKDQRQFETIAKSFEEQNEDGDTDTTNKVYDLMLRTLSLEQGMDIKTISHMLGHTDAGFTMNTYMHVTDTMQQTVANAMGNLVAEKENEKRIKIIQYTA